MTKKKATGSVIVFFALLLTATFVYAGECRNVSANDIPDAKKKYSLFNDEVSKPYAFDDIGCALLWRQKQCISIQMTFDGTARVHDFISAKPIYAKDAFFLKSKGVSTPGGYGIIAFEKREEAEKHLKKLGTEGKVLSFDELLQEELKPLK